MKIYKGYRESVDNYAEDNFITVDGKNFERAMLQKSLDIRNHSPTGFNWGYGGSGPHQLALALLMDATNDNYVAETFHHDFTKEFVSQWGQKWETSDDVINAWVKSKQVGLN